MRTLNFLNENWYKFFLLFIIIVLKLQNWVSPRRSWKAKHGELAVFAQTLILQANAFISKACLQKTSARRIAIMFSKTTNSISCM